MGLNTINVSNFNNGIYLMQLQTEESSVTKKIIKK